MPVFEKTGSQSKTGWDASTKTQTLKVGDTTEITLRDDATGGDALTVMRAFSELSVAVVGWGGISDDCTIHELARESTTSRKFVITALKQGAVEIQAGDHLGEWGSNVVAKINVTVKESTRKPSLVFFPGEHSYTYTDGYRAGKQHQLVGNVYVVGGKGEKFRPLWRSRGRLQRPRLRAHGRTNAPRPLRPWQESACHHTGLGRELGDPLGGCPPDQSGRGRVQGGSRWVAVASGPRGEATQAEIDFRIAMKRTDSMDTTLRDVRDSFIDPKSGKLTRTVWNLNHFGKWGWRLLRMPGSVPTDQFVHTTPKEEFAVANKLEVQLDNSHGCIHIVPTDRKTMMDAGYLDEGVEFEVRPYTEKGPPP